MNIKPEGFSEVGLSTRNLEAWVEFLAQVGGFEEIWRGETPAGSKKLWQIDTQNTVEECLMGCPGEKTGYIRLFRFQDIDQEEIRLDTRVWDSGGIYDIDIRVRDLLPLIAQLKNRGWKGLSEQPVEWQFGPVLVREWLIRGPDSVIFGLIQRIDPPLEGWKSMQIFSHVFNSAQVVSDMQRTMDFYRGLGFVEVMRHSGPLPGRGGEVLGLSPEMAPGTPVELVILQSRGALEGAVELVGIGGIPGRDVTRKSLPHNIGFNLLRFPVSDLLAYATHVEKMGIKRVHEEIITTRLEPFGETELLAVQTPDGVWLEFYQAFTQ